MEEKKAKKKLQGFYKPYVRQIANRYFLPLTHAVFLLRALLELKVSTSMKEINRVHSFCYYADIDNKALHDLYVIISKKIGIYLPENGKAVFRLKAKARRDAPEVQAIQLARELTQEAMDFFRLPPDVFTRAEISVSIARLTKYHHAVMDVEGNILAHACSEGDRLMLRGYVTRAGDLSRHKTDPATQNLFKAFAMRELKGRKSFRAALCSQIYALARIAMSDSYYQLVNIVAYLRLWYPQTADILMGLDVRLASEEYAKTLTRMPPEIRPYGEMLNGKGIYLALRTVEAMAQDDEVKEALGCRRGKELSHLTGLLKEALNYVKYCGFLSARNKTRTKANISEVAQYIEIDRVGKAVAVAVSKAAAMRIVKAEEYLGRQAALSRARKAIDAYMSADDLV